MNRHFLLSITILAFGACAADTPEPRGPLVRDSAGIQIVESSEPLWQDGDAWMVSPNPVLEIGVSDGEDPYLLDMVRGIVSFENGTIVVANMGDNTLRYYDETGQFLYSAGGSGGGPTEFAFLSGLRRLGDSVLAWQGGANPSKVFDLQGNFVRALNAPTQFTDVVGVFDDGSHLFGLFRPARPAEVGVNLVSALLYLSTPDFGDADSLARVPAAYVVGIELSTRRIRSLQKYGSTRVAVVGDSEWYYGWPETYEFQVRGRDATVRRIVRRAWEPMPVTEADRQRHRESTLNVQTEGGGPAPPQLVAQRRAP